MPLSRTTNNTKENDRSILRSKVHPNRGCLINTKEKDRSILRSNVNPIRGCLMSARNQKAQTVHCSTWGSEIRHVSENNAPSNYRRKIQNGEQNSLFTSDLQPSEWYIVLSPKSLSTEKIANGSNGDIAIDSYHRYQVLRNNGHPICPSVFIFPAFIRCHSLNAGGCQNHEGYRL